MVSGEAMMKTMFYLVVYGFLGYLLERIINLAVLGIWYDNRVLFGPVQPMYGLGVVMTIGLWSWLKKRPWPPSVNVVFLCLGAIVATMIVEHVSGTLHEHFYHHVLWDYRHTFPACRQPYTCWVPSGMFGLLAAFTAVAVHPHIVTFSRLIPRPIRHGVVVLFAIDFMVTYHEVLL